MDDVLTEQGILPGILRVTIAGMVWQLEVEVTYHYRPGNREAVENRTHGRLFTWMGDWICATLAKKPEQVEIKDLMGPLIAAMNSQFGGATHVFDSATVVHVVGPLGAPAPAKVLRH